MGDSNTERSMLGRAVDTALVPVHAATSRPAQRAYLGTFLFAATSVGLTFISTLAYFLFYYNYVPQIGVERTIYLQFGNGHPYGVASLDSSLASVQSYDITLYLHVPRSPTNLAVGNFMVDLALLGPDSSISSPGDLVSLPFQTTNTTASVLARSRRPTILTYASPIVDTANTLSGLAWYMMGWRKESEVLEVNMFEGVQFSRGWKNIPGKALVMIEVDERMQFYDVGIGIVARFGGLRYVLYNHRILSYLFFTTTFFSVSLMSTGIAYFVISSYITSSSDARDEARTSTKPEPTASESEPFNPLSMSDFSDTSRTFATLGRQVPLHFSSRSEVALKHEKDKIKREEEEEIERTTSIQPLVAEADDEDEEEERDIPAWRDSGIGTSFEEGDWRGVQRRKRASLAGRSP